METVEVIALMMGAAWASGINLYATILVLGWMGGAGHVDLPPDLQVLMEPSVMFAAGIMYFIEFFADKTPGVDTGWDAMHTFVRIPAGALMAAGASGALEIGPAAELIALLLGGSLAATSHATKAGSRVLINTSPEPVSNWTASIAEDIAVIGGLWAALHYPIAFLLGLILFIALVIWLLPKLWRAIKRIAGMLRRWFSGKKPPEPPPPNTHSDKHQRAENLRALYDDTSSKKHSDP